MANFTFQDITGSTVAVLAFVLVLCAPGYVLAQVTNLFGFRARNLPEQLSWAVACSFGVMPIAGYLVGRYAGLGLLCWFAIVLFVAMVALLLMHRPWRSRGSAWTRRDRLLAGGMLCGWTAFVVASLVDVQVGSKLYFTVAVFDQSYRVAFTDAVTRTGVPPANPMYFAGHLHPMRYYYFWYVICATIARIAHVSSRQVLIASSVWSGLGLVAIIGLYVRYFFDAVRHIRRQTLWTVLLLAVTGADLVPAIGSMFAQTALNGEMEWWSIDQFYSWVDSPLWVPHHLAGLLCCLFSFLLLWRTREPVSTKQRVLATALAGVSFASAFGLSIYVAFGFALLMLAWILRLLVKHLDGGLLREQDQGLRGLGNLVRGVFLLTKEPLEAARPHGTEPGRRDPGIALSGRVLLAGLLSAVVLMPFVRDLTSSTSRPGTGARHAFQLSIRRMIDPQLITGLPIFGAWNKAHPILLDQAMRLLLLLPGLALELGFYGAVLVFFWRARRSRYLGEAHATALYLSVCGLVMVLFIRSSVITNNDFGYRAALLPQFFLLLLGGSLLASWWFPTSQAPVPATPGRRRIAYSLLALGLAGTLYQVVMLRIFLPFEAARPVTGFAYLPEAAFQARVAFAQLNHVPSHSAVVEFNPVDGLADPRGDVVPPSTFFERTLLMDSNHQILNSEPECAAEFGGDDAVCGAIRKATNRIFASPAPPAAWAQDYCRRFGVQYLVVTRMDPVWQDPRGWAATLPVIAREPDLRIVRCG